MRHLLKRHPLPVKVWFQHSLVLTCAFPEELPRPLLPAGLLLDTLVLIEGVRERWSPKPVAAEVRQLTFFNVAPFDQTRPVLANAF